jgi:predicted ATPase
MITQIEMSNFKCYKDPITLDLKNFNAFCGVNSSGKSSINQAILLLLQNNHGNKTKFVSNGHFVHFDDFKEIKNSNADTNKEVSIKIKNERNKISLLEMKADSNGKGIVCSKIKNAYKLEEESNIYFLSASRIGPEDVYEKYKGDTIGALGERAIGLLAKKKDATIEKKYIFKETPETKETFIDEVNYWLKEIIGEKINPNDLDETDRSKATYSKDGQTLQMRNKNTGSGLSYVIAVIIVVFSICLKGGIEKPTIIIENPEIHLHPKAQINMMVFLKFMSRFCQIIIETHSEHILKAIMDERSTDNKIFVLGLNPDGTTKVKGLNHTSFKISPISYPEVQYEAFNLITADFLTLLYARLHDKYKNDTNITTANKHQIKVFDKYLDGLMEADGVTKTVPVENFICTIDGNNYEDLTLLTYVRNSIDHPVNGRRYHEIPYNKLEMAVQIMLGLL